MNEFKNSSPSPEEIKDLVISWREKGETAKELTTLVNLIFEIQPQIDLKKELSYSEKIIDVCGTGGDKANTFNISTLTAIVLSSMGVGVIKHSGKSSTSVAGSVDILNSFNIGVEYDKKTREELFVKTNLMFVSSSLLRELFASVKKVCKEIDMPGFVNLLGPISNSYKTDYQLLGVSKPRWGALLRESLKLQKKKRSIVVYSELSNNSYLDELSFCGLNKLFVLEENTTLEEEFSYKDIGKSIVSSQELEINSLEEGKVVFEKVLKGSLEDKYKAKIDVVALNVGGALYAGKMVENLAEGYEKAFITINSGKPWEHFTNFINCIKKV